MKEILVTGAGRIGWVIALMLAESGQYRVCVADRHPQRLETVPPHPALVATQLDIGDPTGLEVILKGKFAVLSALPFHLTSLLAESALKANIHYLDLTEDVAATKKIMGLAQQADKAFIPQCGLAPGFISIVTQDLTRCFDRLDSIRMRVGALPQFPSNALNYNLTWSLDGLINEYIEPCEAIVDGKLITAPALEEREEFSLDGVTYEAFNTSGGLGTFARTMEGRVRTMNYRTIRYPGHQAIFKLLLQDLKLKDRRETLKDLLEQALPVTLQDVVILFVTVCGWRSGQYLQETYAHKIYPSQIAGQRVSAIQLTTAAGICTLLDLLAQGKLANRGFVRQEEVLLADFLGNRFGRIYDPDLQVMKEAV